MPLVSYKDGTETGRLTLEPRALTSMPLCLNRPLLIIRVMRTVHLLTLGVIRLLKVILVIANLFSKYPHE